MFIINYCKNIHTFIHNTSLVSFDDNENETNDEYIIFTENIIF